MNSESPIDTQSPATIGDPPHSEAPLFGLAEDDADASYTDGPAMDVADDAPDVDDNATVGPDVGSDDLLLDDDDGLLRLSPVDEGDAPGADSGPIWFGDEADAEDLRVDPQSNDADPALVSDTT